MADLKNMNLFAGTFHEGDLDLDTLPPLKSEANEQELLDYVVLVLSRFMSCSVAFKGGYMLNQLLQNNSRMTHDVDLSVAKKGDYEGIKVILKALCEKLVAEHYVTSYKIKETIEERSSGGVDMYDSNGRKFLGVDVGLHNISYGIKHYDLSFTDVDGFNVERMLADKLIAITTRKRFRRTKDLYDFYAITNFFDVDLKKLAEYVELRTGAEWENIPFSEAIIVEYKKAWDKLKLIGHTTGGELEKPDFSAALGRYYAIALLIKEGVTEGFWRHQTNEIQL